MSDFREMCESMQPSRADLSKAINQKIAYRKKCEQLEAKVEEYRLANGFLKDENDRLKADLRSANFNTSITRVMSSPVQTVCRTCIFVLGTFAGAIACLMVLQAKGLL